MQLHLQDIQVKFLYQGHWFEPQGQGHRSENSVHPVQALNFECLCLDWNI